MKVSKENHVIREYTVVVTNSSVIQNVKIYLLGDVNVDGKISIADARMLLVGIANKDFSTISKQGLINGDVNYDGGHSIADARKILVAIANRDFDSL